MTSSKQKKNFFSIIFKLLYYLVLSLICLIVIFLLYYIISSQLHADDENYKPRFSIYTIVSPSMTPVINVYDVVVNTRVDSPQDIQVGDIITYKSQAATSEGMTITHRVTEVSQLPDGTYEYMTQGDNNSEPDSLYVTYDTVIGKEIIIIPYLGRLQFLIANQKGWLFLLLIPVSIYLIKEIFTLIDLFGLRKKVDKVVGTTEDNIIEKKKIEKIKEEERKALIKEELRNKEIKKDSKLRNPEEPEGFLERYTETIITVKSNKYEKNKKTVKKEELEIEIAPDEKIDIPTSVKASNVKENERPTTEEIILPSLVDKKTNVNEQYEILDTDELTTKIKEYDSKIEQLDKMIKDMEVLEQQPKKEQTINELEEVDNFLIGTKLKVTKIEPTKNQHKNKTEKEKKYQLRKKN